MTRKGIRFLLIAFMAFVSPALFSSPGYAADFYVVDGDTFSLNNQVYRIWGIDAPEKKQLCQKGGRDYSCGVDAKAHLASLITNPEAIKCETRPRSKKETRIVALCGVNGQDLGQLMVSAGWAIDYKYFSKGYYSRAEAEARADNRGIWAGQYQQPRDWRKEHPY